MALHDTMYPYFGVAHLRDQRGRSWAEIVDHVSKLGPADPHVMAFTLTLRRIRKEHQLPVSLCKDPLCAVCAADLLTHYTGSEEDLVRFYFRNYEEIQSTIKHMRATMIARPPVYGDRRAVA